MPVHHRPRRIRIVVTLGALACAFALAAPALSGAATRTKKHSGTVNVLYAASLLDIMQDSIGPHFHQATGYSVSGYPAASGTLANEIKAGTLEGDVFISANPSVNQKLEGSANGNHVTWFADFGQSGLVLGYNPSSSFATALTKSPWYKVITRPGFRIGRTDPATDPKGVLTVRAIAAAAALDDAPQLTTITATTSNVYPEATLVGLLQSGQLDAGFFYTTETTAAKIPTIKLGVKLEATYTVSVLANAPHNAAAVAFTKFLFSPLGRKLLAKDGLTVIKPSVHGTKSSVPRSIEAVLSPT